MAKPTGKGLFGRGGDYGNLLNTYRDLNFVQRIGDKNAPTVNIGKGGPSTHYMATERDEQGNWFTFPTIVQKPDGTMQYIEDPWQAMEYGKQTGEIIPWGTDKENAIKFGAGGYKETPQGQWMINKNMVGGF